MYNFCYLSGIILLMAVTVLLCTANRNLKRQNAFLKIITGNLPEIIFLKRTQKAKEDFVANVVHDLKSPVTAQLNGINLILNGAFGPLTENQRNILELIKDSNEYLFELVMTIMDTYIHENGKIKLSPQQFDFTVLINQMLNGILKLNSDKKLKFRIINEMKNRFVVADMLQIKRVVKNLITNAILYSVENSEIGIHLKSDDDYFEFNIINRSRFGVDETLENIFEKFRTLKNSKSNNTSSGLGLYLSKQIIEMHNGTIYARKLSSDTCLFGFKIPCKLLFKYENCTKM